jgi:hypothetical protein
MRAWVTRGGEGHGSYPAAIPRESCVDLFRTLGCTLEASFRSRMGAGYTEVLVFQKKA